MEPSYWTPEAQIKQSFPQSPLVVFALARQLKFAVIDTVQKSGYLDKKENDAYTTSLYFRGAINTKNNPSAVGEPELQNVTKINNLIRY